MVLALSVFSLPMLLPLLAALMHSGEDDESIYAKRVKDRKEREKKEGEKIKQANGKNLKNTKTTPFLGKGKTVDKSMWEQKAKDEKYNKNLEMFLDNQYRVKKGIAPIIKKQKED